MNNCLQLLDFALGALKSHGICGECKHYTPYHMQGLCADCINDTAQSLCQCEYLTNNWTWKYDQEYQAVKRKLE